MGFKQGREKDMYFSGVFMATLARPILLPPVLCPTQG